jgi:hypothetical protein
MLHYNFYLCIFFIIQVLIGISGYKACVSCQKLKLQFMSTSATLLFHHIFAKFIKALVSAYNHCLHALHVALWSLIIEAMVAAVGIA